MQFFQVNDWSGGIDDNYLSSPPNCAALLKNWWIDENKKINVRAALNPYETRMPTNGASQMFSGIYLGQEPFGRPVVVRADKAYFMASTDVWTEIVGPTGNPAIPNKLLTAFEDATIWRKQLVYVGGSNVLPSRIYCDSFTGSNPGFIASYKAVTLGLPALASDPMLAGTAGSLSYVYAFYQKYTFTDYQGTVFQEQGPVNVVSISSIAAPNLSTINITAIPVLANTSSTNYATASVTIEIYRTIANGTSFYFLTSLTNGTTSYADTSSDASIQNNEELYTDGGVLQYDQPPISSKYMTQVNDFFWYATEEFLTHSIQGVPGGAPSLYYQYTEQRIRGLNCIIGFPILFCDRSIYRVEGNYDEFGDGGFDLREISKTAGCVYNRSIVSVPGGLVWAGNGGFYFTDGYQVTRICKHLASRYVTWQIASIVGTYDSVRNMVFWTISNDGSSTPDALAVLHLNFGISERMIFTTWNGGGIYPTTCAYSESVDVDPRFAFKPLIADYRGYLLSFDESYYSDPILDISRFPSDFLLQTVIYRMESVGLDMGQDATRKYCTQITCEFGTDTNCAMEFQSRRDDGGPWASLSQVRSDLPGLTGAIIWGISEYPWDSTDDPYIHDWDSIPVTEAMRQLPAGTLRSTRRQIALTNALTQISKSDDLGLATVDLTLKRVTLDDIGEDFPDNCEGYWIAFADDSYTNTYKIKGAAASNSLDLYDPYGTLTAKTSVKWQMSGYAKNQRPQLLSFSVFFDEPGEATQPPSRGNAGLVNA